MPSWRRPALSRPYQESGRGHCGLTPTPRGPTIKGPKRTYRGRLFVPDRPSSPKHD
ncbi:MAG: hypothetical protein ACLU38_05420 [Dysosmobacter sp.]